MINRPTSASPKETKPRWSLPERAAPYEAALRDAEYENQLPPGLLGRMAYQESRFRDDIINGDTISRAGAVGIMQIVPRWHPDVDPLNPYDSIAYAGKYIRRLYNRFGSWDMALAAYNWGQGNLSRKGFENAPKETVNYVRDIMSDIA